MIYSYHQAPSCATDIHPSMGAVQPQVDRVITILRCLRPEYAYRRLLGGCNCIQMFTYSSYDVLTAKRHREAASVDILAALAAHHSHRHTRVDTETKRTELHRESVLHNVTDRTSTHTKATNSQLNRTADRRPPSLLPARLRPQARDGTCHKRPAAEHSWRTFLAPAPMLR
jgi:hypothetical protein